MEIFTSQVDNPSYFELTETSLPPDFELIRKNPVVDSMKETDHDILESISLLGVLGIGLAAVLTSSYLDYAPVQTMNTGNITTQQASSILRGLGGITAGIGAAYVAKHVSKAFHKNDPGLYELIK